MRIRKGIGLDEAVEGDRTEAVRGVRMTACYSHRRRASTSHFSGGTPTVFPPTV
jgi:hypothetical protein